MGKRVCLLRLLLFWVHLFGCVVYQFGTFTVCVSFTSVILFVTNGPHLVVYMLYDVWIPGLLSDVVRVSF